MNDACHNPADRHPAEEIAKPAYLVPERTNGDHTCLSWLVAAGILGVVVRVHICSADTLQTLDAVLDTFADIVRLEQGDVGRKETSISTIMPPPPAE